MVQLLWKTVWRFLKKLKIQLPYTPASTLLGIYPKEQETGSRRDMCTPVLIAAYFTVAKRWKTSQCPSTDEWINKR